MDRLVEAAAAIRDADKIEFVGVFPDYASAEKAWRAAAQRTVDDAEMKYVVVHLHRLLEPDSDSGNTASAA